MRPSLCWTAYVSLLGGSGQNVVQEIGPIQRSFRWLGSSLWWTAYVPLLGWSSPDVVQEWLEDAWSTMVMIETSDQVCMVISKWAYSREI